MHPLLKKILDPPLCTSCFCTCGLHFSVFLCFSPSQQKCQIGTFKVFQWTMEVSGKFKKLSCEWTLWASIAQCHKVKKTKWKTNYTKYYHSKRMRVTLSLALLPYIQCSCKCNEVRNAIMIFCLLMKAEKGNIGRYCFFPGNFSSLWAILFSFPLTKKLFACRPQFTCTAETRFIKPSIVRLAIEKKVDWNYEYVTQLGCKENRFYSLPFGQAEASIY